MIFWIESRNDLVVIGESECGKHRYQVVCQNPIIKYEIKVWGIGSLKVFRHETVNGYQNNGISDLSCKSCGKQGQGQGQGYGSGSELRVLLIDAYVWISVNE